MYRRLVAATLAFVLVGGAGAALPYGRSVLASEALLGGGAVPDEPATERSRVVEIVASKSVRSGPAIPHEHSASQVASGHPAPAADAVALARVAGAARHTSPIGPVPLRC